MNFFVHPELVSASHWVLTVQPRGLIESFPLQGALISCHLNIAKDTQLVLELVNDIFSHVSQKPSLSEAGLLGEYLAQSLANSS